MSHFPSKNASKMSVVLPTRRPILTAYYHSKPLSRSPGHYKDGGIAHSYCTYISTESGLTGWPSERKGRSNVTTHTLLLCLASQSRPNLPLQQPPSPPKKTPTKESTRTRTAAATGGYTPTKHTHTHRSFRHSHATVRTSLGPRSARQERFASPTLDLDTTSSHVVQ